jgi:hypothetical protein
MKFLQIVLICSVISLALIQPSFGDLESPRKQIKFGVSPEKVTCDEGLVLMLRPSGMPACVKPTTAEKLEEKGWKQIIHKFVKAEKEIETVPASNMSIINFYITDNDLNLAHNAVEVVSAEGLFEFTINGVPLNQDDVVLIRYLDESDSAGEQRVLVKSVTLTKTFAKVETYGGGSRIGHEFTLRIYEPDANRDSKDEDKIPLSSFEYRGDGGIRTTLANPRFDANSSSLIETGPNTGTFEVKIKIPRELDGKVVHIGDKYEIRYIDRTTPSGTNEKIIFKGRIG